MVVIDASALVELLLAPDRERIEALLREHDHDMRAPVLVDIEALNALRRLRLSPGVGGRAVSLLLNLPIARYRHEPLLPRAWELRQNFTAYDAAYVALAEALSAPLLTRDTRLARAVKRHTDVAVTLAR